MKRVFTCFSLFAITALIISPVFASTIDYTDPANNPTGQVWAALPSMFPIPEGTTEFPVSSGPSEDPIDILPNEDNNPYGTAIAHAGPGWEFEWTQMIPDDPMAGFILALNTWHFEGLEPENPNEIGTITIEIPNNPENNPLKEITWSLISDKAPKLNDDGHMVSVDAVGPCPPYSVSYPMPQPGPLQLGTTSSDGGVWYEYRGVIQIEPNPEMEYLTFEFYECTNILKLTIDTVCVPVPEPCTLALLISGFGLLMVTRRRK